MSLHELPEGRPLPQLLTDLVKQLTSLTQKELALARAEMGEKMNLALRTVAMMFAAAVLLIPALVILLQAAVQGMEASGLYGGWASLTIGGFVFLAALLGLWLGYRRLMTADLKPERTIEQLREDAAVATAQVRQSNGKHRAA